MDLLKWRKTDINSGGKNMPDYSKYYEARGIVTNILQKDFVGPVTEDEILPELPTQYYIMGKLYPQSQEGDIFDLVRNPFLENEKNADVTLRSLHKTLIYFIFDNHKLSALFVNKTDWFLKIN